MDIETQNKILGEIIDALGSLMDKQTTLRDEVQPTESVLDLAARAALNVIVAFELGYKME